MYNFYVIYKVSSGLPQLARREDTKEKIRKVVREFRLRGYIIIDVIKATPIKE